jgi:hypothetical protein
MRGAVGVAILEQVSMVRIVGNFLSAGKRGKCQYHQ